MAYVLLGKSVLRECIDTKYGVNWQAYYPCIVDRSHGERKTRPLAKEAVGSALVCMVRRCPYGTRTHTR